MTTNMLHTNGVSTPLPSTTLQQSSSSLLSSSLDHHHSHHSNGGVVGNGSNNGEYGITIDTTNTTTSTNNCSVRSPPAMTASPPVGKPSGKFEYERIRQFKFTPPEMCPVFRPTKEEFALGPLEYINRIRSQAEKHGICKIIPPTEFSNFTFKISPEFRFMPRIQRISELEARTRIRLNFHDNLHKFWELQGVALKFPTMEQKMLDYFVLHNIVRAEGGFDVCTRDRKWAKVANQMGFSKNTAFSLHKHYERVLFPYDLFGLGATIAPEYNKEETKFNNNNGNNTYSNISPVKPQEPFGGGGDGGSNNTSPELKKLQVFGAGPKMPGVLSADNETIEERRQCQHCHDNNASLVVFTCNRCHKSFHNNCLYPPLIDMPKGKWHCQTCLHQIMQQLPQHFTKEFGFYQSFRTYTLFEFAKMANQFKKDYFKASEDYEVDADIIEKEFWRIASSFDDPLHVEYGADLHTNDYGSGFPTHASPNISKADLACVESPWNLNNLPTSTGSVFKHINTNINGMIIPWMYVGMCFSAFCWHNEDHWTYSINYLHWGDPKIWYGVPGDKAEVFENAMRKIAPELFKNQPDLLHQLVTTCNPNLLVEQGVPIYKARQNAGEFVVTFPRSYHAGFNQGFNFAEAVNFASPDWLSLGRQSIAHYASLHRYPVFSHDELICKMADDPKCLETRLALATLDDIVRMIESEKSIRLEIMMMGVTNTQRNLLENLNDDERQCDYCKTTCFLSALRCECNANKLVCLFHHDHLCVQCPMEKCTLIYRYSFDEMRIMLEHLNQHIDGYGPWEKRLDDIFDNAARDDQEKASLAQLKQLLTEADRRSALKQSTRCRQLRGVIEEATLCAEYTQELIALFQAKHKLKCRLTYEQFCSFINKVQRLPCTLDEQHQLEQLQRQVEQLMETIIKYLTGGVQVHSRELKRVLDKADTFTFIDFGAPLAHLRLKQLETDWLDRFDRFMQGNSSTVLSILRLVQEGKQLATPNVLANIKTLQHSLCQASRWLKITNKNRTEPEMHSLEFLIALEEVHDRLNLHRYNFGTLYLDVQKTIRDATAWNEQANKLHNRLQKNIEKSSPSLQSVESLLESGKDIKCKLERFGELKNVVRSAKSWITEMHTTMVETDQYRYFGPVEVVTPRHLNVKLANSLSSKQLYQYLQREKLEVDSIVEQLLLGDGWVDHEKVKQVYDQLLQRETEYFAALRKKNARRRQILMMLTESDIDPSCCQEIFCFCSNDNSITTGAADSSSSDNRLVECQLCRDWFHLSCALGAEASRQCQVDQYQLYICPLCSLGRRPSMRTLVTLMANLRKLSVRFLEGELFKEYFNRVQQWKEMLNDHLNAYPELKLLYNGSSLGSTNLNEVVTEETKAILDECLCEAFKLRVDFTTEIARLWKVSLVLNPDRKTVLMPSNSNDDGNNSGDDGCNGSGKRTTSRPNSGSKAGGGGGSKAKRRRHDRTADYDEMDAICAYGEPICVQPNGSSTWVQCDQCNKWYHQLCLALRDDTKDFFNLPEKFFCSKCVTTTNSSNNKHSAEPPVHATRCATRSSTSSSSSLTNRYK